MMPITRLRAFLHRNSVVDRLLFAILPCPGNISEFVINAETKRLGQGGETSRVLSIPAAR